MLVNRTGFIIAMAFYLLLAAGSQGVAMSRKAPEPNYAPGEVLVKFHGGTQPERAEELIISIGGKIDKILGRSGIYLVRLPDNLSVEDGVEKLSSYPEVKYAEPNYRMKLLEK